MIEDIGVLKPAVFVSVPRLFNRIYDQGALNSGSAVKAALFTKALNAKIYLRVRVEIKLVSVPEMNYYAKGLKGEVWVRGPEDKKKTDD